MAEYIKLSRQEILDKDFEVEYKGYKVEEVDYFLDMIAEDYKIYADREIKKDEKIRLLEDEVKRITNHLNETIANLKLSQNQMDELAKKGLNNSDIIKRISNLEKDTYSK